MNDFNPMISETSQARINELEAENEQLRAALLRIAQLDHGASSWGPGLARLALIRKYTEAVTAVIPRALSGP